MTYAPSRTYHLDDQRHQLHLRDRDREARCLTLPVLLLLLVLRRNDLDVSPCQLMSRHDCGPTALDGPLSHRVRGGCRDRRDRACPCALRPHWASPWGADGGCPPGLACAFLVSTQTDCCRDGAQTLDGRVPEKQLANRLSDLDAAPDHVPDEAAESLPLGQLPTLHRA